jgi:WXXGXW repeat (2 copies)
MNALRGKFRKFFMVAVVAVAPVLAPVLMPPAAHAAVVVSVGFGPPALPVYTQPLCPGDGYLWTPGYWAYGPGGYYWVPGVWVQPPTVGLLWTPGYWGWGGSAFIFHAGYWGPHVGFYGGINYGFGYGGVGFYGGRWAGGHFAYNTAVMNVNRTIIHNTYVENVHINNVGNHTSFNGGRGGIDARPGPQEMAAEHENHIGPTGVQQSHIQAAQANRGNFASANGGHPQMAAMQRPGATNAAVAARGAQPGGTARGGFGGEAGGARPAAQAQNHAPTQGAEGRSQPQSHAQPQAQQPSRSEGGHPGGEHPRR